MRSLQRSKRRKLRLWVVFVFVATISIIVLFLFVLSRVKKQYDEKIDYLLVEKEEALLDVYVANKDLKRGEIISEVNTESITAMVSMDKSEYITYEDFGKVLLIDISKNTQLIKAMLLEPMQEGLREVQCDSLLLSGNIQNFDYVDVRLALPNGEDYVVLSKKSVHGLIEEGRTCYLWLSEEEIVKYSAAVVDAKQYVGASLYTTKYIEPTIQEATRVTYIPSYQTLGLTFKQQRQVEEKHNLAEVWD